MQLTKEELTELAKCNGLHSDTEELFTCVSCAILLKELAPLPKGDN